MEGDFKIERPGGQMPFFAAWPEGGGPFRAVIIYMDLFGPRDEVYYFCRKFAAHGFVAVLHNMFYRLGAPIFEPANGRDDPVDPRAVEAGEATTVEMALEDTNALIDALDGGLLGVGIMSFGAIGYCMGGRHALAACARRCDRVKAGLSVHGGKLVREDGVSPHSLIQDVTVPFHFALAEDDPTCPDTHQLLIERTARDTGPHISCQRYAAHHGWSFPARWSYDADVADKIWTKAFDMFASMPNDAPTAPRPAP